MKLELYLKNGAILSEDRWKDFRTQFARDCSIHYNEPRGLIEVECEARFTTHLLEAIKLFPIELCQKKSVFISKNRDSVFMSFNGQEVRASTRGHAFGILEAWQETNNNFDMNTAILLVLEFFPL